MMRACRDAAGLYEADPGAAVVERLDHADLGRAAGVRRDVRPAVARDPRLSWNDQIPNKQNKQNNLTTIRTFGRSLSKTGSKF